MAFGADELRVLRRALAIALHPTAAQDEDIKDCLRLAESVDEAVREADRLRTFLLADLARYRDALPGSLPGYTELLQDALATGYDPGPDDLAALRALRSNPVCAALLERCRVLAERSVRARLAGRALRAPAPRTRLLTLLDGGAGAGEGRDGRKDREDRKDGDRAAEPRPAAPARPAPATPAPERPVPKPSEAFPPRRRPVPPPEERRAG
ncbi:hypothetical protein ACGFW5_33910 [Streptomyces sp. NPDC048416]|uniref:hypothetical protein n=1 Tax=Streptomyces sp. NPDC048416 TaxID=3365546 RepID=UPI00371DBC0A